MTSQSSSANTPAVRQALEQARNSEDGHVGPHTAAVLEAAITKLWANIQARPDSYVLDAHEFALFNYFRDRFGDSPVARRAVARFWDNYQG